MTRPMLDSAARSVTKLGDKIDEYVSVPSSNVVLRHDIWS